MLTNPKGPPPPGMRWTLAMDEFRRFVGAPVAALDEDTIQLILEGIPQYHHMFRVLAPYVIVEEQW